MNKLTTKVLLTENELKSILKTNESLVSLEKNQILIDSYHDMYIDEDNKSIFNDVEFTYKNAKIYITKDNVLKDICINSGLKNDYNKAIKRENEYNKIVEYILKQIKYKIIGISKITNLEQLKKIDKEVYLAVVEKQISPNRQKRFLEEIKKSMTLELHNLRTSINKLSTNNDKSLSRSIYLNIDSEKLELIDNIKKFEYIKNNNIDDKFIIKELNDYYLKYVHSNKDVCVLLNDNLYTLNEFIDKYNYFIMSKDNKTKEMFYHQMNSYLFNNLRNINISTQLIDGIKVVSKEENKTKIISRHTEEEKNNLFENKLLLFENSNYLYKIKGIKKLAGYYGYIYKNGQVIFEKYYKNNNSADPTIDEAIYVMSIDNFLSLMMLSKTQIIKYIEHVNSDDLKRIFHDEKWQLNVKKEISKNTKYNESNIEKEIYKNIVKNKNEILKKYRKRLLLKKELKEMIKYKEPIVNAAIIK